MASKVLITGGAGFLGRWFLRWHVEHGDEVFAIDDLSNPHSWWPALGIGWFEPLTGDMADCLHEDDNHYDLAYHFAAPVGGREKIEGDPLFNADSLRLDSEFFRWAIHHVKTVVYPSSSAVYGVKFQGFKHRSLSEGLFDAGDPDWAAPDEMYGFTKLAGERLAYSAAKYGLDTLCIRPFSGYGEGQSMEYPVPSIAKRAKDHEDPLVVWGSGAQSRDFIHVEDLVAATLARLEHPVLGYESMNIGSGTSTTFIEVAGTLADLAGYNPPIVTDETKPEGVLARYAETTRMRRYYKPQIGLREGLKRVLDYV